MSNISALATTQNLAAQNSLVRNLEPRSVRTKQLLVTSFERSSAVVQLQTRISEVYSPNSVTLPEGSPGFPRSPQAVLV
jgi:hypothetical protein